MRVSTAQIFNSGSLNINRNLAELFKLQNQLSTGRRVLSPEDDPVASAQALVTTQAKEVNTQYMENQDNAQSQLAFVEGQLSGLTGLLQDIRERTVQLGNASLSDRERRFIADEMKSQLEHLTQIGNAQNGEGLYLFSGFQGAVKPFATSGLFNPSAPATAANAAVNYVGDAGERLLQVEASRQMGVTLSGAEVFLNIKNGNGTFSVTASPGNTGSGLADAGSVLNLANWNSSSIQPQNFAIVFDVDNSGTTPVLKYNIVDAATNVSLFVAPPAAPIDPATDPATGPDWKVFTPGQAISLSGLDPSYAPTASPPGDLGAQVVISGTPNAGDRFALAASSNQSLFDTLRNLISIAETPVPAGAAGNTAFMNRLGQQVAALDAGLDNVLRNRATVGARLAELDALKDVGSDLDIQFAERLAKLQDLDFAAAISDLTRKQTQLEAAQSTFAKVSQLSLFNFL